MTTSLDEEFQAEVKAIESLKAKVSDLASRAGVSIDGQWRTATMLRARVKDGQRLFPDEKIPYTLAVLIRWNQSTGGAFSHYGGLTPEGIEAIARTCWPEFIAHRGGGYDIMILNARGLHPLLPEHDELKPKAIRARARFNGNDWIPVEAGHECPETLARFQGSFTGKPPERCHHCRSHEEDEHFHS